MFQTGELAVEMPWLLNDLEVTLPLADAVTVQHRCGVA